jgi:hypothetical protein
MKTKLTALLTISALLSGAQLGYAQFRPVDPQPVMPSTPVTPITPIAPLIDVRPFTVSPPIPALPATVNPPPAVYVPPVPSRPPPILVAPREVNPPPVYVAPAPREPDPVPANGGDGLPPMSAEQAFVIAVCANDSDVSSECLERSGREAAAQLSRKLLQSIAKDVYSKTISIRFPYMTSPQKQFAFLKQIETVAIAAVHAKIQADIERLKPFYYDSLGTKSAKWEVVQRDRIALNKWNQSARAAAQSSSNWLHDWRSQTHTFNEGPAYRQLKQISISGWGGH